MAQNDDDPYNLDRWNAEIRVLARLQRDARKVATLDPDREVVITAEDLDELENTTDYLALRVRGLVGQSATGNVPAGVLYDELMLYKPIGRESRALALHAYHAALGPMPDQQRRFHDASAMHQIAAATVLDRVIQLGHEHGLPSLHWSMGASCNLVGEVVRTAPGGHTLALLAYWAWFGLLGAGPDGERISVNRLDGVAVRYAHGVNVGIHYDYSDLKAETATS